MSDKLSVSIPITVELASSLEPLVNHGSIESFKRGLASDVTGLLGELGLRGQPLIEVRRVDSRRHLRIRVHGVLETFELPALPRAWQAVAPEALRYLPETSIGQQGSDLSNQWFDNYVESINEPAGWRIVLDCLRRLVLEVLRRRPACLLGPSQTMAYIDDAISRGAAPQVPVPPETLSPILKSLLNLGIALDKPEVWQTISSEYEIGSSVGDITESIFALLRSDCIEIHLNRQYLKKLKQPFAPEGDRVSEGIKAKIKNFLVNLRASYLDQVDASLNRPFLVLEDWFFTDLGLRMPEIVWVGSSNMADQMVSFKINDVLGPSTLGIKPEELFLRDSVNRLASLGVKARGTFNPANGQASAVIDGISKNVAEENDLVTSDASEFVAMALRGELSRLADRLLSADDVEFQLAQFEQTSPALVRAIESRFSLSELTQIMRGLVEEGLSLRNPRAIFERLLQFDTIPADDNTYKVFDDRLPIGEVVLSESKRRSDVNYREFVRSGLKNYISYKYVQNKNSLSVIRVEFRSEPSTQGLASDGGSIGASELGEERQEELRDAIRTLSADTASTRIAIVTTSGQRPIIRKMIAAELPDIPVLAERELRPGIELKSIARVCLSHDNLMVSLESPGGPP